MKIKKTFKIFGITIGISYVLISTIFIVWMFFADENSYLRHREYDEEIHELETWIEHHKQQIQEDKQTIQKLQDSLELERFAREKYLMKKKNEDIYIIEFDTLDK